MLIQWIPAFTSIAGLAPSQSKSHPVVYGVAFVYALFGKDLRSPYRHQEAWPAWPVQPGESR